MPWYSISCVTCRLDDITYCKSQEGAVTEMHALQGARLDCATWGARLRFRKRQNAPIGNLPTLDQSDALQFRQRCQLLDGIVGEVLAAREIDVSDTVAQLHKLHHTGVCDTRAVTQVDIMQILAQTGDCHDATVRDLSAFSQHKVAQPRSSLNNPLDSCVLQLATIGKVENA